MKLKSVIDTLQVERNDLSVLRAPMPAYSQQANQLEQVLKSLDVSIGLLKGLDS